MGGFTMRLLIFLLCIFNSLSLLANDNVNRPGYEYCFSQGETCIDSAPRVIDGETASPDCWEYREDFTCYSYPQNSDCTEEERRLPTTTEIDRVETPLLTNIDGTGVTVPQAWKEVKEADELCDIDTGYECTDWYLTPDEKYAKTCYTQEPVSCAPENCMVTKETCTQWHQGMCVAEDVEFTCNASSVCTGAGIEAVSELGTGFEEFVAATSVADVVAEYSEVNDATGLVTLFSGEPESCKRFTSKGEDVWASSGVACAVISAYFGQSQIASICLAFAELAVSNELRCCKDDPADVSGRAVGIGYCDDGDIELAVARKTKRAVRVGEPYRNECVCAQFGYLLTNPIDWIGPAEDAFFACSHLCKNEFKYAWTLENQNVTMDMREQWCKFNDPLAKIIQEQGREQITQIINSPASTKEELNFSPNYLSNGNGKWSSLSDLAGNRVAFWEWDKRCNEPESYMLQSSGQIWCPKGDTQIAAVCSNPEGGCGPLPDSPNPIKTDWDLKMLLGSFPDEIQNINKYTQATGQCFDPDLDGIPNSCNWDMLGLPAGIGSQSIVSIDMNWQPHMPLGDESRPELQWLNKFSTPSLELQTQSATYLDSNPALPVVRLRQIGANAWETISLSQHTETVYTTSSGVTLTFKGECSKYACRYKVSTVHNLTLKPWATHVPNQSHRYTLLYIDLLVGSIRETKRVWYGEHYIPHCEGFTLEEFMALDISKMDLSDYLDTINEDARDKIRELLID